MVRPVAIAFAALLLLPSAQAAAQRAPDGLPLGASATLRDDRMAATLWVQRSVEFERSAAQAFELATARLPAALAAPGSAALEQTDGGEGKPPAVIFDVDETLLDNSPYEARAIRGDVQGFDRRLWDRWVSERAATAVPGAVAFVSALRQAGVTPIFVTNRECGPRGTDPAPCPQEADTLANLEAVGFGPVDPAQLMLKGERPDWTSDKGTRRQAAAADHRIVMLVGDQFGDLMSVSRREDAAARDRLAETHTDRFATRWIVIPNPMYGAWLDILGKTPADALRP